MNFKFFSILVFSSITFLTKINAAPPYEHNAGTIVADILSSGDVATLYFPKGDNQKNQLFSASILFAADDNFMHTSVAAPNVSGNTFEADTAKNTSSSEFKEPAGSSSEQSSLFLKSSISNISGNIEVQQNTYTYDNSFTGVDGLLEMEVIVTNRTNKAFLNTYGGAYFDFDTGSGTHDKVGYDEKRGLYYQYNTETGAYIGFGISSGEIHSAHFRQFGSASINKNSIADGVKDEFLTTLDFDAVFIVSQKIGILSAGQSVKFVVAVMLAKSYEELTEMFDYSKINRGVGKSVRGGNVTGLSYGNIVGSPPVSQNVAESAGGGGCLLNRRKRLRR